ncbi:hypothetical protein ACOBQX_12060 [Actinokineospora sp. G85]|uniref:hypothetical protein n=1 Tax=Actinokineospora sp. G85 TaxID=3406626 RepID=UPI003C76FA2B
MSLIEQVAARLRSILNTIDQARANLATAAHHLDTARTTLAHTTQGTTQPEAHQSISLVADGLTGVADADQATQAARAAIADYLARHDAPVRTTPTTPTEPHANPPRRHPKTPPN